MPFHPPSEFEANRISPGDSVCEALAKVFRQVGLDADNEAFKYNEDGTFTTEYISMLCATGCGGGSVTTSSGGGSLEAVSDLSMPVAYDHSLNEYYRLKWSPVSGATKYAVYRNTVSTFATATLVLAATVPDDAVVDNLPVSGERLYSNDGYVLFLDDVSAGTTNNTLFFYWVVASNASDTSAESNVASGRRFRNYTYLTFGVLSAYTNPAAPYVVPAGLTRFVFSLFGEGGAGGGGSLTNAGGGGGGAAVLIGEVLVAAGNQFYAAFTTSGIGGSNSSNGAAGASSILYYRASGGDPWLEIARAVGGGGGDYNGAGGVAGSGSTYDATYFLNAVELVGYAGQAATGDNGGYTGAQQYYRRWPQGTTSATPQGGYYGSNNPGGGSDRAVDGAALPFATGGNSGGQGTINWGFVT